MMLHNYILISYLLFLELFSPRIIYVQPVGHVEGRHVQAITEAVRVFYGYKCVILPAVKDNPAFYAASKKRYDAEKMLNIFNADLFHDYDNIILLITQTDIAHKKDNTHLEYGIMGLGKLPGNVCIVSTYRLGSDKGSIRLKKITIHELGHNLGLSHCTSDSKCLMSSAHGTLKQVDQENMDMCSNCKHKLNLRL